MARLQGTTNERSEAATGVWRAGFARSEDGSLIIFGLLIFVMMLTAGGMGVDFMRFEAQRARLQATLDRAVLAASSLDQPLEPKAVVIDYFQRAGLGDYITADDITVVSSPIARSVSASVSMDVPSLFLNFVGITKLAAPASATAQQLASQTEISLVLDVSGSMGWNASGTNTSKIEILRDSAATFVNMMLCDPSDPTKQTDCTVPKGTIALNIVPYSEQVLVGEELLGYLNASNEHSYSSCVHFEDGEFRTVGISDTTPLQRAGHFDARASRKSSASNWTCKTDAWRKIVAYEDDVVTLQNKINDLRAGGWTSIDLGMKWGAALLDPDFQPVVADMIVDNRVSNVYEGFPLSWNTRGVQKVVVLMTDGVNTYEHFLDADKRSGPAPIWRTNETVSGEYIYSVYRASTNEYYWPDLSRWEDHPFGTGTYIKCGWWSCSTVNEVGNGAVQVDYPQLWAQKPWNWYSQFSWLDYPGNRNGESEKNAHLSDICTAAKTDGMTIFTIGFDTSETEETVLRNCATKPSYHFDANGLDLAAAFAEIARQVSKLQLVN